MCGFAFLFAPNIASEQRQQQMSLALDRLAHRGPDEAGIAHGASFSCGHRRLSIIDLAASRQPMADSTGRFTLVFNGEIYNYQELRKDLLTRWTFSTEGDTEVLLAGLVLENSAFLNKMEGMWAFALWDEQQQQLLLSRDRMGKKPLYYQLSPDGIVCASELPALRALSAHFWQEDMDSTADFLRYGYYLPGTTAYQQVKEVLPGHWFDWSQNNGWRQESYWKLSVGGFTGTHQQARELLDATLTKAVERRMVADVEVGAFLSGGVDSSLVVALMKQRLGVKPKTFTIGFQEAAYDERQYARLAAQRYGTDHYEQVLEHWNPDRLNQLVLNHIGQPFADSSLLPTALVSELAARHVKVALSGDGGDELFSGYQRYQARALLRWYTRLPKKLRGGIEQMVRWLPEPMAHHSRSVIKKAHLFLDIAARQIAETPYIAPLMFTPKQLSTLAPELAAHGHIPPSIPEATEPDDLQRMMAADALVYLPQDILVKVDRASMAHALEARAPFLDRDLVELAFSLPRYWHRRGFQGKRMLRETFAALLPNTLWRRRKQGFGVPLHDWFRGEIGEHLRQWLADDSGPLAAPVVRSLLDAHVMRRRDHGYRLWLIYVYLLWRRAGV